MDNNKTGQLIARRRKAVGLTQRELAERLGVTNKAVSKWETGGGLPDVGMLKDLCRILEISVDELLDGEQKGSGGAGVRDGAESEEAQKSRKKRKIAGIVCVIPALLLICMQGVYLTIGKRYQMEYISDLLLYLVYVFIILFLAAAVLLFFWEKKAVRAVAAGAGGILALAVLAVGISQTKGRSAVLSLSPDFHHMLVLKYEEESGLVTTYRNQILWFARVSDRLPYTAEREMKTQWLAGDVCAVTYESPDDGNVHQYVMTYGDRGDGITTPYVYNVITGSWAGEGDNMTGRRIKTTADGIVLSSDGETEEIYTFEDCVQFGALAIALCREGLPQWTLVLDNNCVIGESGYLEDGGTISLCNVSMEKTAPVHFMRTDAPETFESDIGTVPDADEAGKTMVKEMKAVLRDDPALADFKSSQLGYLKVEDDSDDMFWIARCAIEENDRQYAVNGIDVTCSITHMEILAGDSYDYLVRIISTNLSSDPYNGEEEEMEMTADYRIMKGDGVYLAYQVPYGTDGKSGLEAPSVKQEKDTQGDADYTYTVPGERQEEQ